MTAFPTNYPKYALIGLTGVLAAGCLFKTYQAALNIFCDNSKTSKTEKAWQIMNTAKWLTGTALLGYFAYNVSK